MTIDGAVALLKTLDKWLIFFGVLVAAGVVGEAVVGFIHFRKSGELQRLQTAENLSQQKEISRMQLQYLQLEAQIQPRYLTKDQQESVTTQMRPFSGTGFLIASHWIDAEGERLAAQLKSVLNGAGMGRDSDHLSGSTVDMIGRYPEIITGLFGGGGGPPPGPIVRTGVEVWGKNTDAVNALVQALASVSAKRLDKAPPGFERFGNSIPVGIFVGVKPEANPSGVSAEIDVLRLGADEAAVRLELSDRKLVEPTPEFLMAVNAIPHKVILRIRYVNLTEAKNLGTDLALMLGPEKNKIPWSLSSLGPSENPIPRGIHVTIAGRFLTCLDFLSQS